MAQAQYTGGCHCGDVRYEVAVDLDGSIECNCSICSKRGSILAFTPRAQFKLLKGEGKVTSYFFNKHAIEHIFCKKCGILSYALGKMPNGAEMAAINARCLEGVDAAELKPKQVDGKSF